MRVRFAGFGHTDRYAGSLPGVQEPMRAGDERDVPDETGEYLLRTFPGAFVAVAPAPSAPPADRMVSNESFDLSLVEGTVSALKDALASGSYSIAHLMALRAAERDGRDRITAVLALEAAIVEAGG